MARTGSLARVVTSAPAMRGAAPAVVAATDSRRRRLLVMAAAGGRLGLGLGFGLGMGGLAVRALPAAAAVAERIISVGGDVTEIVFALGEGEHVVAVDTTSVWPEEATQRPKVGYLRSLAAEGLLSMRPDLLLVGSGAGPAAVLSQVRDAGVRVAQVPEGYSLDIARSKITTVIEALEVGQAAAAREVLAGFDQSRADLATAMAELKRQGEPRATLLLAGAGGSPQAAGRSTAGDAVIDLVGARNVFDHPGYKAVSIEALAAAAPDVILVLSHDTSADARAILAGNPIIQLTPAGRDGRILSVSSGGLLAFGLRTPAQALDLARRLRQPPTRG